MRIIFCLLMLSLPAFAAFTCPAPTVTTNYVTGAQDIAPYSIRIQQVCNYAGFYNSMRVRWGTTSAYACPGSAGPCIQGQDQLQGSIGANGYWVRTLTGLPCGTLIYFATEISFDNTNWDGQSAQGTATTAACPSGPILPTAPATFTVDAPAASPGGTAYMVAPATCANTGWASGASAPAAWAGTTNCSDQANVRVAMLAATFGDRILMAPGSVNTAGGGGGTTNTILPPDAPDAHVTTTPYYDSSTGTFTAAGHGMSNGTYLHLSYFGGTIVDALPAPWNPGYRYCVVGATTNTFQLATACGGSAVTGGGAMGPVSYLSGGTADDIVRKPEIIIRTTAPDTALPPFGTNIDPSYYSQLPIIQNTYITGAGPNSFSYGYGGNAHDYRILGVAFEWLPIATAGDPDPTAASSYFFTTTRVNYHITLDRVYIRGGTNGVNYPDRSRYFAGSLDGHYIAIVNSYADNMGAWTPSNMYMYPNWNTGNTPAQPTPSGTNTQTFTGPLWRGWPINFPGLPHPRCDNALTITVAGTGTAVWEIGPGTSGTANCQNLITATSGTTVTATDSSGASVSPTVYTGSPDYVVNGSGNWTNYPIAKITFASGVITGLTFNGPSEAIHGIGGNDGPATFVAASFGPGPYLFKNDVIHNVLGEYPFHLFTGQASGVLMNSCKVLNGNVGCALLKNPGDVVIDKVRISTDKELMPNPYHNPNWNGMLFTERNQLYEIKEGNRVKITGSSSMGGWCVLDFAFNSFAEMGTLNDDLSYYATPSQTSDIEFAHNTFGVSCGDAIQIFGQNAPLRAANITDKIYLHDNIFYNTDRIRNAAWSQQANANGDFLRIGNGAQNITFTNNIVDGVAGLFPAAINTYCSKVAGNTFKDNIISFSNDDAQNGMVYSDCSTIHNFPGGNATGGNTILNSWTSYVWKNNWLLPMYSDSKAKTAITNAQITSTIAPAYSGLTGTNIVTGAADSIASRYAAIGWSNPVGTQFWTAPASPLNYDLATGSAFLSGAANAATNGRNIGPDVQAMIVAQGIVIDPRFIPYSGSPTIAFTAPTTTGCPVDWSTDNFATWTRVANAGGDRVQSVVLTGLTSGTPTKARINCEGPVPVVSFTAP